MNVNHVEKIATDLEAARNASRMGLVLAELRSRAALAGILLDHESDHEASPAEREVIKRSAELDKAIELIGTDGVLIPPVGCLFAVWSNVRNKIEISRYENGTWVTPIRGMKLNLDTMMYDGTEFIEDHHARTRYIAPTAGAIMIEHADSVQPGAIYAHSPIGNVRYRIDHPDYTMAVVPELTAPNNVYVREKDRQDLRQALIE